MSTFSCKLKISSCFSNHQSECSGQKPCHQDSYCDPIEGTCKPRLPEGGSCFFKDQCRKTNNVLCIWGRCSPGTAGQPGEKFREPKKSYITCSNDFEIRVLLTGPIDVSEILQALKWQIFTNAFNFKLKASQTLKLHTGLWFDIRKPIHLNYEKKLADQLCTVQ